MSEVWLLHFVREMWLLALNHLSLNVSGYLHREMCIYGTIHSQAGVTVLKSVNIGPIHFKIYNSFATYFKWERILLVIM